MFRQRQINQSQDSVHGRPQLVAHVGQEAALRLVGGFRHGAGQLQLFFGPLLFREIAKNQHHAPHRTIVVADRRAAVIDGGFPAIAGDQAGMIRQPHDGPQTQNFFGRTLHRLPRDSVDDVEHLRQRLARGFLVAPSRQPDLFTSRLTL